MTPEEVAQKFEKRAGLDLVDYAEVGLPIYRLSIDVVTVSTRLVSTINEFVLRLIEASMLNIEQIAEFLGLPENIVHASISEMQDQRWIVVGGGTIALTQKGREVHRLGHDRSPQDETVWVDFDAITRRPIALGREVTLKPSELANSGRIGVRPYPAEPPAVADLRVGDVQAVLLKEISRRGEPIEVLAINRIARRSRLFRNAVCLVYKAQRGRGIEVAFAINGILAEEHERSFLANKGPEKMGFVEDVSENDIRQNLRRLLGTATASKIPDVESVRNARIKVSTAKLLYDGTRISFQRSRDKPNAATAALRVQEAKQALTEAQGVLERFPVRPLAVFEHRYYLEDALSTCVHQLILSSPRLLPTVVDSYFVRAINGLLANNVRVDIYLQMIPSDEAVSRYDAIQELVQLGEKNPRFRIRRIRASPISWLVKDREFVITSSFPWLSYKDKSRAFRREAGLLVRDAGIVTELVRNLENREIGRTLE